MTSPVLTDNAVLQRGALLPFSGQTDGGSEIVISFLGNAWTTAAGEDGAWQIAIGPLEAGGPGTLVLRVDDVERQFRNVVVGDVWVCSGQSNMEMALRGADTGEADAAGAADPDLRLMTIPTRTALAPATDIGDCSWQVCAAESAIDFSALAYYAGRDLRRALSVPIGVICAAVGATPGEAWVPMAVLEGDAEYAAILERWRQSLRDFPDPDDYYGKAFAQWDHDADLAEREGRPIPGPHPKLVGPDSAWTPAGLFNGMIAPLTATPIKGVFWYQGAAAPERAYQYRALFRRLIQSWRRAWKLGDMPFIYGQEANFGPRRDEPGEHSWAELREAQFMGQAEPNTAMAVAIDLGQEKNIHPIRKAPLGERLALAARNVAYGHDVACAGPEFAAMTIDGDAARIRFENTRAGLRTSDGRPPVGFAVSAGCTDFTQGNRGFGWAEARIEGDVVIVRSDSVKHPAAVRYAWAQNPDCNLVNSRGLPAAPFRTDDWPGVTIACR